MVLSVRIVFMIVVPLSILRPLYLWPRVSDIGCWNALRYRERLIFRCASGRTLREGHTTQVLARQLDMTPPYEGVAAGPASLRVPMLRSHRGGDGFLLWGWGVVLDSF